MARRKCETAHIPASPQENGTRKINHADTCTSQNTPTVIFFTMSDLPESAGHRNAGGANSRQQTPGRAHHCGKDEAAGKEHRRNSKLERDFAEARHIGGA